MGLKYHRLQQARLGKPLGLEAYKAGEWVTVRIFSSRKATENETRQCTE